MCLKDVSSIALPEYLASFLSNILWQIPVVTVAMHAHLWILSTLLRTLKPRVTLTA